MAWWICERGSEIVWLIRRMAAGLANQGGGVANRVGKRGRAGRRESGNLLELSCDCFLSLYKVGQVISICFLILCGPAPY